jgi:hypothetical protein
MATATSAAMSPVTVLDKYSPKVSTSSVQLFDLPGTQIVIDKYVEQSYRPVNSLTDGGPVTYRLASSTDSMFDPQSFYNYTRFRVLQHKPGPNPVLLPAPATRQERTTRTYVMKIKETAGDVNRKFPEEYMADVPGVNFVAPIDNAGHSIWAQQDIYFNGKMVSSSGINHALRCHLEIKLSHSRRVKEEHLKWTEGVAKDTAGFFDVIDEATAEKNKGFLERAAMIAESAEVEMCTKMHADVLNQQKLIPSGLEIEIVLFRSKPEYFLQAFRDATGSVATTAVNAVNYRVEILESTIFATKVYLSITEALKIEHRLMKETIKISLTRTDLKNFTLPASISSKSIDSVYTGQLPTRMCIMMATNSSQNGSFEESPFNFQAFDLRRLTVYVSGVPMTPYEVNFSKEAKDRRLVRAYHRLYRGLGIENADSDLDISLEEFAGGNAIFIQDLTADGNSSQESYVSQTVFGDVRIELLFGTALPSPVNVIVFSEFLNCLQIDRSRQIE